MPLTEQVFQPVAVALHTRDRDTDYHWYPETGEPKLSGKLREFFQGLLANFDAKPAAPATFLLFDEGDRVGLLVGNLTTNRSDHLNTRIDDSLMLEFDSSQRSAAYRLAAGLLGSSSSEIQQQLLAYAEDRFRGRNENPLVVQRIPANQSGPSDPPSWDSSHIALRSNETNCRRVARLLNYAADHPGHLARGVLIVSTGFVGKDRLEQFVPQVERMIVLSRSSTIPEEGPIRLTSAREKKRQWLARPTTRVAVGVLMVGVLMVGVVGHLLQSWPTFSGTRSSQHDAKQVENFERRIDRLEADLERLSRRVDVLEEEIKRLGRN